MRKIPSRPKLLQLLIGNKIENNRLVSNYRHYSFKLNRKQCGRRKITVITGITVVTVLITNDTGMVRVGCSRCTYPSFHFFVSRSRSIVDCARVQAFTFLLTKTLSRSRSVVWCCVWCWWCVRCFVVVVHVCGVW